MNTVDEFVMRSIQSFPEIYRHRTAVLHHALCIIGNGMHWDENGNVVSEYPEKPWDYEEKLKELRKGLEEDRKRPTMVKIIEKVGEDYVRNIEKDRIDNLNKQRDRVKNAHELAFKRVSFGTAECDAENPFWLREIYPQYDSALLMNIPENVSPEWRDACEEMKVEAMKNGWVFD